MSNTITIELCKEDRKRLDEVIAFLGLIVSEQKSNTPTAMDTVQAPTAPQEEPEQPAPEIGHPVDEVSPHAIPEPVAGPELPKYTTADILAKVQTMATPSHPKRKKAKAIVESYGVKKVSDIPEDKRNEAMLRLIELEQAPLEG